MAKILRQSSRGAWAAVVGYSLLTLVIYHKAWWRGQFYFAGDLAQYHGPSLHFLSERLAQGHLPQWNPLLYAGTPFLVSPQTGVFYPPNWVGVVLAADRALTLLAIAHLALAAVLMYAFCRQVLGVGALAAFLGAVTFSCAGNLPAHFEHTAVLMSGAWLPGILLACHRGLASRRSIWFVLAGGMLGLAILAGGVQFVYLICWAITLLFVFHSIAPIAQAAPAASGRELPALQQGTWGILGTSWLRFRACVVALCIVASVAACVGCAQLLPTMRFIPSSLRSGGMGIASARAGSLPPLNALILSFCPHFFGHEGNAYWGVGTQQELSMYLGLIPSFLAPLALVSFLRRRAVIFLALLGAVSLILSFGGETPIYPLAYSIMPGLAYFRAPVRFLFLYSFAGAALGAVGLEELLGLSPGRRTILVAGLGALCVAFAAWGFEAANQNATVERLAPLGYVDSEDARIWTRFQLLRLSQAEAGLQGYYWRLYLRTVAMGAASVAAIWFTGRLPKWGGPVLALVLCLDLVGFSSGLSPWGNPAAGEGLIETPSWIRQRQDQTGKYRYALPELIFHANLGMLYGLPVMDGYDPFLPQNRHTELVNAGDPHDRPFALRLAQLFAVAYEAKLDPSLVAVPQSPRVARESMIVNRDDDVPPRARLIDNPEFVSSAQAALERVLASDFDPWRMVVVEMQSPLPQGSAELDAFQTAQSEERIDSHSLAPDESGTAEDRPGINGVRWKADEPERLELEVETARAAWLLVSDAYWPAWKAYVNGQERPIRRANYYFRAVRVPAGRSVVAMHYIDRSIWLSAGISLTACAVIVAMLIAQYSLRHER